jgi:hypothetical protein
MSDKHEISPNWSEQNVRITHEVDKLHQAVMSCIYSYKYTKIILAMKKIQDEIERLDDSQFDEIMTLMAKQDNWNR